MEHRVCIKLPLADLWPAVPVNGHCALRSQPREMALPGNDQDVNAEMWAARARAAQNR